MEVGLGLDLGAEWRGFWGGGGKEDLMYMGDKGVEERRFQRIVV